VRGFVTWHNEGHRHSGIRFVTPAQRPAGEDKGVLAQRHVLYQAARHQNPARWSGKTRHWNPVETASLNPAHKPEITPAQQAA
jgi:hypothetical protein